jgi:YVTN family beta-propeller protein
MIFELLALNKDISTAARPKYLSPIALVPSPDGKYLYVAEQTAKQIAIVDLTTKAEVKNIKLPNEPTGIAVSAEGRLYVTCSSDLWPDGMVCVVDPDKAMVLNRLPAGQGARSPVLSHDGNTLYVCNTYEDNISVINVSTGGIGDVSISVMREPFAAAITPDDSVLVVTNCLPVQKATDTLKIASRVILIDAYKKKIRDTIPLPTGSHSVFGVTVSPDGKNALVTHLRAMFNMPSTWVDGGWVHTNNCAIIDIKKRAVRNDVTLDAALQGAGNPWGVACSPDGSMLCVAHAGSGELSIIDMKHLVAIADSFSYSPELIRSVEKEMPLSHDFAAISKIMDKVPVIGKSPRAVTVVGNIAYTAGYFEDYLELFDLGLPGSGAKTRTAGILPLGPATARSGERRGEYAFINAGMFVQKWESCFSCHPLIRSDGLNWKLRGDLSAPIDAKTMLYSWWTPPTGWTGLRASAYESIRAGVSAALQLISDNIQEAVYIDTLLMKLKPVPSPHLAKGRLSAAALRGKKLFFGHPSLDCIKCHPAPLYADMKYHNSGIEDPYDASVNWDTPSLVECWRTAPYGHLGSKLTVKEMVSFSSMSNASSVLSQSELDDLVEFILSL